MYYRNKKVYINELNTLWWQLAVYLIQPPYNASCHCHGFNGYKWLSIGMLWFRLRWECGRIGYGWNIGILHVIIFYLFYYTGIFTVYRCKVSIKYGTPPLLLFSQPQILPASFASTIQLTTCYRPRLKQCSTNTCTLNLNRGAYCLAKHMHVIFNLLKQC